MKKYNNIILFILLSFVSVSIISSIFLIRYYLEIDNKKNEQVITNIKNDHIYLNTVYDVSLIYKSKKEAIEYYSFSIASSSKYKTKNLEYKLTDINYKKYIKANIINNNFNFNFILSELDIYKIEILNDGSLINKSIFNLTIISKHMRYTLDFKINTEKIGFNF